MADWEDDPIYPIDADAVLDGDRLEVLGKPFGPAGVSVTELPDGSTWQVDHADPATLVGLDVDADTGPDAPLLVTAFGGDGAMFIADGAVPADEYQPRAVSGRRSSPRRVTSGRRPGRPAEEAGALVVLSDLADDTSLHPVARVAAVVELAEHARGAPGGRLFATAAPALLDRAETWCERIDDTELDDLDPKQAVRLSSAIQAATSQNGRQRPALRRLAQRLGDAVLSGYVEDSALRVAASPLPAQATDVDDGFVTEPPPSGTSLEWISDTVARVHTTRSDEDRWVRVLRRDGLVLLALAPLERTGLVDRAGVALPPDLRNDELIIQLVADDEFPLLNADHIELARAAVQAGRTAARATRLGDRSAAEAEWEKCAQLWDRAGDRLRTEQARQLGYGYRSGPNRRTLLVDLVSRSLDAG